MAYKLSTIGFLFEPYGTPMIKIWQIFIAENAGYQFWCCAIHMINTHTLKTMVEINLFNLGGQLIKTLLH
ncbi:MAG: hypothetical protein P8048_09010, partial [Calditrichia bacterium]